MFLKCSISFCPVPGVLYSMVITLNQQEKQDFLWVGGVEEFIFSHPAPLTLAKFFFSHSSFLNHNKFVFVSLIQL